VKVSATRSTSEPSSDAALVAVVTFELNGTRFALLARAVREVYQSVTITPLPHAPASIEGFVDVRGTIAPVYDLRSRLGLPGRPQGPDDHLLIAQADERLVVIRVDRAIDLAHVPADQLDAAATPDSRVANVAGIARLPDGLVVICDLTAFLSPAESNQLAAALEAT
jgi:purine-binding chemotaxis protein CheW